ncbi:MAG: 50S ribosomal protein L23 [Calditerrivibrio nitroreducens]|jgi:large subunit ribosomal protein L23|uniref:Large ribosomal subunit protein uL23 n=2 Tax=Calditerrivibrio nitroreducens TaxID=477976 RepID=E4TEQ6_CALNY|nr:50S ribosomal protein L23 [Calditerrivibrio nitroreducens]ADR19413.1 LSU ribosomal protein L23P [Calditerrivibrio nitroreducens DSM 19672]PMP72573.1 MAG: 50S ribosomal protein L23 [Calditerrivibrio nitroreducens]
MLTIYDVIKRPLITEKAVDLKEKLNQVVFEVDPRANKIQIKEAVEKLFNVKVKDVRTMGVKGKVKRFGMVVGRRDDWKKAIVVLEEDQKLEFV